MKMPQDLRDTIGWIVLESLPADMPVAAARRVVKDVLEQIDSMPEDVHKQPPPPSFVDESHADESPERLEEAEQWPTVLILRRALMAVFDSDLDMDPAMAVLVEQAIRASDWVEQYREEHDAGRRSVRGETPRGPLPDLSSPAHLSPR